MALFAGERPIMTGEELTYDYNFDPFSAKNVQECRCGSANCRGILGPRPKDQKPKPTGVGAGLKRAVSAGKRKLKELLGGEADENEDKAEVKKRKIAAPAPIKTTVKALEAVKGLKRTLSKTLVSSLSTKKAPPAKKKVIFVNKRSKVSTLKTYGTTGKRQTKLSSRNSSLTIVAADEEDVKGVKGKGKAKAASTEKSPKEPPKKGKVGRPRKITVEEKKVKKNTVRSVKSRFGAGKKGPNRKTIRVIDNTGEEDD